MIEVVFETHSTTVDNKEGRATGWLPGHLDHPYLGGESWRQAITRVDRFLADLSLRWNGKRILVIGRNATRWGLDHISGRDPA